MSKTGEILDAIKEFLSTDNPQDKKRISFNLAKLDSKEIVEAFNKANDEQKEVLKEKFDKVIGTLESIDKKPNPEYPEIKFPDYPEEIEIKNYKELAKEVGRESKMDFPDFPTSFEISNLDQISFPNRFEIANFPSVQQVEVLNQIEIPTIPDFQQYTKPTKPIAVRISDGKYFQELANLVGEKIIVAGGGGGSKEILIKEINHGNLTTASGSATSLSESSVLCRTVTVQSHPENQGYIYIGKNTVTPISYGGILQPGEPKDIEIDDVSRVFVSADYDNEKISWMIVR